MNRLLLAAALVIAAPAAAQRPSPHYHALGTEPGWALTIDRQIRYEGDYGETRITAPTPRPRAIRNGKRYATKTLTVEITRVPCNDGMSDRRYPDTVLVRAKGKLVRGCGGLEPPPPAPPQPPTPPVTALVDGEYRVAEIGGLRVLSGRPARLTFAGGTITGDVGCNRLRGSYRQERGRLTMGPVIGTRMACPGPLMRQEQLLTKLLEGPLTIVRQGGNRVMLEGERGGGGILLERR